MRKFAGLVVGVLVTISSSAFVLGEDDKPKYTIKEVMAQAHKGKMGTLRDKVMKGEASMEERQKLADLYEALAASKPPKGDEKDWKKKTTALAEAAKALVKDGSDKKAIGVIQKGSNCKICHEAFKG